VFFFLALILLVALPSPWRYVGFGVCLALFAGEVVFWNRRVRGRSVAVGAETLIGRTGTVVTACRPDGQVRLGGEIWEARCDEGADRGEDVVVTAQDGLRLIVVRTPPAV
jgi:membrane protein implicated in regulation of membrane protease activity